MDMNRLILAAALQEAALQQDQMSNGISLSMPYIQFPGYGYPPQLDQAQLALLNGAYDHIDFAPEPEHYDDEDEDDEDQRTLFCGNLDERVTEEILYEVFLQAGPIESARIPKDTATGRQRNFGFVTYVHTCAVPYALQLYQGLELFQKKVTIKHQAADKPNQQQQQHQRLNANGAFLMPPVQTRTRNPFAQDEEAMRPGRRSLHDAKPYDRKHNNNNPRRRSDTAIMDFNRPRNHQQQQHNNSGGDRRSEQRNQNYDRRR